MGLRGLRAPTPAQILEAPIPLPDASFLDQPPAKDLKMGRHREPPWACWPPAHRQIAIRSNDLEEGTSPSSSA
jgi:hypothetical protein